MLPTRRGSQQRHQMGSRTKLSTSTMVVSVVAALVFLGFTVLLTVLFVVSLFSVALAGGPECAAKSASAACSASATASVVKMGDCCVSAAEAGKGCCGMDADAVEAKFAAYQVQESVLAEMHSCCATAVADGKGCCGKDAAILNAKYAGMVAEANAELAVLDSMHKCCAEAVQAGNGCCGKDAAALQTKYDTAVKAKTTEVASSGAK